MKSPIDIGDKVIVKGWSSVVTLVKNVTYEPNNVRWLIELDWGIHGSSKVYDYDENKTWYRYNTTN